MLDKRPAAFGGGANRPAVPGTHAGHPDQATRAGVGDAHRRPAAPRVMFDQRVGNETGVAGEANRPAVAGAQTRHPIQAARVRAGGADDGPAAPRVVLNQSALPTAQQSRSLTQVTSFNGPTMGLGGLTIAQVLPV